LASILGFGGIGEKIGGIIQKVQAPVTKAVDWVINKAASLVKGAGKLLGIGKSAPEEQNKAADTRTDQQKKKDVDSAIVEAHSHLKNDRLSTQEVRNMLPPIKTRFRLKTLEVVTEAEGKGLEKVHVHAAVNPEDSGPTVSKLKAPNMAEIEARMRESEDAKKFRSSEEFKQIMGEALEIIDESFAEYEETTSPAKVAIPKTPATGQGIEAREEGFEPVRDEYAEALNLEIGEGGQVHHAIELQVLDRYPGVFTAEELNDFSNMRGIQPEVNGKKQLHNSAIRRLWNEAYALIEARSKELNVKKGSKTYKDFVRRILIETRATIDNLLHPFFSEVIAAVKKADSNTQQ
jgi:hypothetical protein